MTAVTSPNSDNHAIHAIRSANRSEEVKRCIEVAAKRGMRRGAESRHSRRAAEGGRWDNPLEGMRQGDLIPALRPHDLRDQKCEESQTGNRTGPDDRRLRRQGPCDLEAPGQTDDDSDQG